MFRQTRCSLLKYPLSRHSGRKAWGYPRALDEVTSDGTDDHEECDPDWRFPYPGQCSGGRKHRQALVGRYPEAGWSIQRMKG